MRLTGNNIQTRKEAIAQDFLSFSIVFSFTRRARLLSKHSIVKLSRIKVIRLK